MKFKTMIAAMLIATTAFGSVQKSSNGRVYTVDSSGGYTSMPLMGLHSSGAFIPFRLNDDGSMKTSSVDSALSLVSTQTKEPRSGTVYIDTGDGVQVLGAPIVGITDDGDLVPLAVDGAGKAIVSAPAPQWGDIGGTLSNQADLQSALNAKQNVLANAALLGTYTQTNANLADAVAKKHTHSNQSILDQITDFFTSAEKTKLAGIATGATANSSDATLLSRANHTGTQLASTISDFASAALAALSSYIDATPGGIPAGVFPTMGNKIQYDLSHDGLLIQSFNTPAFASGGFNGGGTGSKAVVGFNNYNNLAFSGLTALSFTAKSIRDEFTVPGNVYWNNLANFNSGALTLANDYVNLVADGMTAQKYYVLTTSHAAYPIDMTTSRAWKAVNGTGALTMTGDCTSGSNVITNISNVNALTVGMYFRVTFNAGGPDTTCVPDGSTIVSINTGANSAVISNNATANAATQSFRQYGGIAPVSRSGTSSGSTTITGITNTADLQVNMLVNDLGVLVPAHSYIVSMVANTSITLNNSVASGTPTLNFVPAGKTGLPGNGEPVIGIPWSRVLANNPNGYFANTAPTVAGGWAAADGGWPKNAVQSAFNFVMGGSGTLDSRIVALKSVTINSDVYTFAR